MWSNSGVLWSLKFRNPGRRGGDCLFPATPATIHYEPVGIGVDANGAVHQFPAAASRLPAGLANNMGPARILTALLGGEMTKNLLLLTCAAGALGLMAGVGHAATATANDAATDQAASQRHRDRGDRRKARDRACRRCRSPCRCSPARSATPSASTRWPTSPTSRRASPTTRRTCTPTSAASAASR